MRRFPPWAVAVALAIFWLGGMVVYLGMQAVPVGGLRGVVLAEETGRPLPGARVRLTAAFRSESYDFRTRRDGRFTARQIPAGLYQLRASTRAHSLGPVVMAVDEGVMRELTLELSPVPPFFELKAPWHTVTLDETPQVIVDGFITSQVNTIAGSMSQTEKTMSELQFLTGLDNKEESAPAIISKVTQ